MGRIQFSIRMLLVAVAVVAIGAALWISDRSSPFRSFAPHLRPSHRLDALVFFPNLIPLPASAVRQVVAAVEPFEFDRIYGAWRGKAVFSDAKEDVMMSAERYIRAIRG